MATKKADPKEKAAPTPNSNEEPVSKNPFDFFNTPQNMAFMERLIKIGNDTLDQHEQRLAARKKWEEEHKDGKYDDEEIGEFDVSGAYGIGYPFDKITHVIYSGGEVKPDPVSLQSINGFIIFRENGKQVMMPLHRVIRLEEREPEQPAEAAAPGEEII